MRKGRGRLSKIDQLPEEADAHVAWAYNELAKDNLTQKEILLELNNRLRALGLETISASAFNRKSLSLSAMSRHLTQMREVMAVFGERIKDTPESDVGLLLIEVVKSLVYDVLSGAIMNGDAPSMADLEKASKVVRNLETGRKANFEVAQIKERFRDDAIEAVEAAGVKAHLSEEALQDIRKNIYGILS